MTRGLRQEGMTLVEVVLAILIGGVVIASTMTALAASKRSEVESQRTEAAARLAEQVIEELKSRSYDSLRMKGPTSAAWVPEGATARFDQPSAPTTIRTGSPPTSEELVIDNTGLEAGPVVREAPEEIDGVDRKPPTFNVWTYVSWRDEACDYPDRCATNRDTKRITVALQPLDRFADGSQPRAVQWFSDIVVDETSVGPGQGCVGDACTTPATPTQSFYLYDVPCSEASVRSWSRPDGNHPSHNTSAFSAAEPQRSSYCWNTNKDANNQAFSPDLMGPGTPPPPPTGDVPWPQRYYRATDHQYSGATKGYGPAGIPIMRTTGCPQSYSPSSTPWTVHSWSTKALTTPLLVKGYFSMDVYAGTYAAGTAGLNPGFRGTVCVTLISRREAAGAHPSDEKILYSFPCAIRPWPRGTPEQGKPLPDGMVGGYLSGGTACSYNPTKNAANGAGAIVWPESGFTVPAGHRLVFKLSVCQIGCGTTPGSDNDLVFFFDHPRYWSSIKLATSPTLADDHAP